MRRHLAVSILGFWMLLGVTTSTAPPVEILRVSAGYHFVRVVMRVERHEGTRKVCLVWYPEGMEDFRSMTCRSEEGLKAPVIYTYEKQLPHGGLWYFKGVVERSLETISSAPKAAVVGGP